MKNIILFLDTFYKILYNEDLNIRIENISNHEMTIIIYCRSKKFGTYYISQVYIIKDIMSYSNIKEYAKEEANYLINKLYKMLKNDGKLICPY